MAAAMLPTQIGEGLISEPPPSPEQLAPHFPQLEILECLGRGGMGVVYKARQRTLDRLVALKLLAPERAGEPQFAAHFEKEARALAALNHPHIVAVYDFGESGGYYYLLMEYVDGVNLRQLLQAKRLTPEEALTIVPPVCDALQCAHDHHIVHCDIKPENLLVDKAGVVKIADFGIAKIVEPHSGASVEEAGSASGAGTPDYSAPEQAAGRADHRADIYSLGVVLYEMLTGERPKGKIEAPSRHVQVDVRIDEIVLRALEEQPELRFATAGALRTSVEAVLASPVTPAEALGSAVAEAVTVPAVRRRTGKLVVAAVVSGLLITGLGVYIYDLTGRPRPKRPGTDVVDFDSGKLAEYFSENILFGRSGYANSIHGVAKTQGLVVAQNMSTEGTLVYSRKSYDLTRLSFLEVSCCFQRQDIGAASNALALGLIASSEGHLSGVSGAPFVSLRLMPQDESLQFQFMSKPAETRAPRSWIGKGHFETEVGQWYRLQVVFIRMAADRLRVKGAVYEVRRNGENGTRVGVFHDRDFMGADFHMGGVMEGPVWVALRACGPGGVALLDDFEILAKPLPVPLAMEESVANQAVR